MSKRKQHAPEFKAEVALEALKGEATVSELASLEPKLFKIGARVVRHVRAITFQLAEVAVTGPMGARPTHRHPRIASTSSIVRVTTIQIQTE